MSRNLVLRTRRSKKRACHFRKAQIKKVDESSLRNVDPKKKPVISNRLFKRKLTNRVYEHESILQKNPHQINDEDFQKKGDDILSHKTAVPSAQAGLTSLFEMGRGEPRRNNHLKN